MSLSKSQFSIEQASPFLWLYNIPDISVNRYMVMTGKNPVLATSGLVSCFAIGARGLTKDETPCLGLAHTSNGLSSECVLKILKIEMCAKGCIEESIEFLVAGGCRLEDLSTTEDVENEILSMAKKQKIVGTKLNLTDTEGEGVSAVLTKNGMFLSKKKPLFEISDDYEIAMHTGECLLTKAQDLYGDTLESSASESDEMEV